VHVDAVDLVGDRDEVVQGNVGPGVHSRAPRYRNASTVMSSTCGAPTAKRETSDSTRSSTASACQPWQPSTSAARRAAPNSSPAGLRASVTPSLQTTTTSP